MKKTDLSVAGQEILELLEETQNIIKVIGSSGVSRYTSAATDRDEEKMIFSALWKKKLNDDMIKQMKEME